MKTKKFLKLNTALLLGPSILLALSFGYIWAETQVNLVKDIHPTGSSSPSYLTNVDGTLFFTAFDETYGVELWKSDGTVAGTILVKDINPIGDSNPQNMAAMNGILYFRARDENNGIELWKSDGTPTGTMMIKDINSVGHSLPSQLTDVNGTLFFSANDGDHGYELWKSDGSITNTTLITDISPSDSFPDDLINANGVLFFTALDETHGRELWKSDGTLTGTVLVKDINPYGSSSPSNFLFWNGMLFFTADDGDYGRELWRTDGTITGTVMVKDIKLGPASSAPRNLIPMNGEVFFQVYSDELWKSDGTMTGTTLIKDIVSGSIVLPGLPAFQCPERSRVANVDGILFFTGVDDVYGINLWKSDGTPTGTVLVRDLNLNTYIPRNLTSYNGTLYFEGDNKLWRSDGTITGTTLVEVADLASESSPCWFTKMNGKLFFSAFGSIVGKELWSLAATEYYFSPITITKIANIETASVEETITYTYRVTNTSNASLTNLIGSDMSLGSIVLDKSNLPPGQATTGILTYTIVEDDLPGPLTNTAIVTGTFQTSEITATTQEVVAITYNATLTLTKIANIETASVGETVTYTYRVTNTGNVSLINLIASDTSLGSITLDKSNLSSGQAATGILTYTVVEDDLPGPLTNKVIVTGTLFNSSKITSTISISVALLETSSDHVYIPIIVKNHR